MSIISVTRRWTGPRAVMGSPLTKPVGQAVFVEWAIQNPDVVERFVDFHFALRNSSGTFQRLFGIGTVPVPPGMTLPLQRFGDTAGFLPDTYDVTITMQEVDIAGEFISNLATEHGTLILI